MCKYKRHQGFSSHHLLIRLWRGMRQVDSLMQTGNRLTDGIKKTQRIIARMCSSSNAQLPSDQKRLLIVIDSVIDLQQSTCDYRM